MKTIARTLLKLIYVIFLINIFCQCHQYQPHERELSMALDTICHAIHLRGQGILYKDTSELKRCINIIEKSHPKQREILSEAYFLLGRNYDVYHMEVLEVPCFINCIELTPQLNRTKGFAYNHFSEICKHQNDDKLGIYFRKKATECFRVSKDTSNFVCNLELLLEQLIIAEKFDELETIEKKINSLPTTCFNSYFYDEIKALKFLKLNNLDSAQYYIRHVENYKEINDTYLIVYKNWLTAILYEQKHMLDSARCYYDSVIISDCDNATKIKEQSYEARIRLTKNQNDSIFISKYFNGGSDSHFLLHKNNEEEQRSLILIKEYFEGLRRQTYTKWSLIILILIVILIICISVVNNRRQKKYENKIAQLDQYTQKLTEDTNALKEYVKYLQDNNITLSSRINHNEKKYSDFIDKNANTILASIPWKNTIELKRYTNQCLSNLWDKLETEFKLNNSEIKLCILILLRCSNRTCAELLYLSNKTIPVKKQRLAKKMQIKVTDLYSFLISIIS